jgi:hypothetical protein
VGQSHLSFSTSQPVLYAFLPRQQFPMLKDIIDGHKAKINSIQAAVEDALAKGLMRQEAYDLIHEAAMKKKNTRRNRVIVEEECPPPSPPPEQVLHPKPSEAELEYTYEAPPAEAEPGYPYEAQPAEPELEYSHEAPPADACEYEVHIEPCCCPEETARPPEQDEATNQGASKVITDTNALHKNTNNPGGEKAGFGFTWCVRCARVDVALYGSKTLPREVRGGGLSGLDNGIAPILCGCSKGKGGSGDGSDRGKYTYGNHGRSGDVDFGFSFEKLKLSPAIFEGSEVARAARAIVSSDVAFVTVNGGVAFKDIGEIVKGLTKEDRMMSVDMKGFREGKREGLLLPYLVGGLIA